VFQFTEDEHSLAVVSRAAFSRAKYSPLRSITILSKIAEDRGESKRYVSSNIFKVDPKRSCCLLESSDIRPEMPGIVCTESVTGK
jgi:hypothetical protein